MTITLNGKEVDISSTTITELLQELDIPRRGRVVHVNGSFVHWTKYDGFQLHEHDYIAIIRGIAGG